MSEADDRLPQPLTNSWTPVLPPLEFAAWTETRETLHLLCQIVGKVRMALTPRRNHWWHVPFYVTPRGLTTGTLYEPNDPLLSLDIEIDLLEPGIEVRNNRGGMFDVAAPLDQMDCKWMFREVTDAVSAAGVDVDLLGTPYDLPWCTTPFAQNEDRRTFDLGAAARYFRALSWVERTFQEFRGDFLGKQTPVHMFWHSFDLALTRFSGKAVDKKPSEFRNPRDAEAYSHEVISFGFWPGDANYPQAAFYSYTAPEPDGLASEPLSAGGWFDVGGSHMARLDYAELRQAEDPRRMLLGFLESAYLAGAKRAGWDVEALRVPPEEYFETA
ncbi:MAG: DUF5996 family protein [Planctomycetota bacterium]